MKKRAMSDEKCPKCGAGAREGETIHEQRRFHCGTAANAEDVLWTGNLCYRNQITRLRAENENLRRAGTVMEQANTQFAAEFVASNATIAELRAKNERLRDGLAEFPCCSCRGTGEQIADTGRHVVSCDVCDGSGKCPDATELLDDSRHAVEAAAKEDGAKPDVDVAHVIACSTPTPAIKAIGECASIAVLQTALDIGIKQSWRAGLVVKRIADLAGAKPQGQGDNDD